MFAISAHFPPYVLLLCQCQCLQWFDSTKRIYSRGHSFLTGPIGNSTLFHHILTQQFLMLWEVPSTPTPNSSATQWNPPPSSAEEGALFA